MLSFIANEYDHVINPKGHSGEVIRKRVNVRQSEEISEKDKEAPKKFQFILTTADVTIE